MGGGERFSVQLASLAESRRANPTNSMILKKLSLTNFRNYSEGEFLFSSEATLVVGPNTSGKTNLIEAICLLSTGRSLGASQESEMIQWGKNWARIEGQVTADQTGRRTDNVDLGIDLSVSGEIEENGGGGKLEVFIEALPNPLLERDGAMVTGRNHTRKQFKVNGVRKSLGEFQGAFRVVVFSPESLRLVLGRPSRRRSYLDRVLSSLDFSYFHNLDEYQKVVRNRNQLLWRIRERRIPRERLEFWDEKLFDLGEGVYAKRKELVLGLNQKLSDLGLGVELLYGPSVLDRGLYEERLPVEIERAITLWGPHRDDFKFTRMHANEGRDLAVFGSRGEQREAVFSLCLAELEVVSERVGERPILLLDDIFSELDEPHRRRVLGVLPKQQTIITSAEPELLNSSLKKKEATVIKLSS